MLFCRRAPRGASGRRLAPPRRTLRYHGAILVSEISERLRRGDASAWMHRQPVVFDREDLARAWGRAIARRGAVGFPDAFQVYAHFPYCRASCNFCMYHHVVAGDVSAHDRWAKHLARLCNRFQEHHGRVRVGTAYFGGGTPSSLSAEALTTVANAFRGAFEVDGSFTCEAHPASMDEAKIDAVAGAGVNRLSMGLQSLEPRVLQVIGRYNPPLAEVEQLIRVAQRRSMAVNLDLVAGLPEQTQRSLREDIERVIDLGADEVTIYRYQPVMRLAADPRPEMAYRSVFTARLLARALKRAYLPHLPDERGSSAHLYRAGPAWRMLRELGAWKVRQLAGLTAEQPPGYWEFTHTRSHTIGLGVGAVSHIYGHAWFREVTALDAVPAAPVYFGSRLTLEDECRRELLSKLHDGAWCSLRELRALTGVDARDAFSEAFTAADEQGAFDWSGDRCRFRRDLDPRAREAVLDAISPPVEEAGTRHPGLSGIEPELVAFPENGAAVGVVAEWCAALSVPAVGKRFGKGRVVAADSRSVSFRVVDKETPPLRVFVNRPGQGPAYVETERFALSYGGRRDSELTDAERAFLADLADRTAAASARAD